MNEIPEIEPAEIYEAPLLAEAGEFTEDTQSLNAWTHPEGNGLRWY